LEKKKYEKRLLSYQEVISFARRTPEKKTIKEDKKLASDVAIQKKEMAKSTTDAV